MCFQRGGSSVDCILNKYSKIRLFNSNDTDAIQSNVRVSQKISISEHF